MTIDTTSTDPPRNWFMDLTSAPTEDLLRHAEILRAKLAHAQERGLRVDARAYELRLGEVERAIAVHNRRATEAEDQRVAEAGKLDPDLCRKVAEALSSGGALLIDRRALAEQLTAAADLAERPTLTEGQVREVSHAAVVDVALAAPKLSATTLNMLAAAVADRVAKELTGVTVEFVSRRFADEQRIRTAVREACERFAKYTLRADDIDAIATRAAKELAGSVVDSKELDLIALQFDSAGIDRTLPLAHQAQALQEKYHALLLRERQTEALAEQRLLELHTLRQQREADLREAFLAGAHWGGWSDPAAKDATDAATDYARSKVGG